jgi:predicted DNA-binding transcriptional regulator AlpA
MTTILADYVTREELAEELKVTTRTLDKWHVQRRGPSKIKLGSRVYYKRQTVLAWLDAQSSAQREAA